MVAGFPRRGAVGVGGVSPAAFGDAMRCGLARGGPAGRSVADGGRASGHLPDVAGTRGHPCRRAMVGRGRWWLPVDPGRAAVVDTSVGDGVGSGRGPEDTVAQSVDRAGAGDGARSGGAHEYDREFRWCGAGLLTLGRRFRRPRGQCRQGYAPCRVPDVRTGPRRSEGLRGRPLAPMADGTAEGAPNEERTGGRDPFDCPRRWEADVVLVDGRTVHLRPIVPTDADRIVALHARLSERTRYLRYFGAYPRI